MLQPEFLVSERRIGSFLPLEIMASLSQFSVTDDFDFTLLSIAPL
jgi:hypothetical protein